MAAPGPGFGNMLIALAHTERVLPCRVLRAVMPGAREQDDAGAARALGASRRPIMLREIRPDILSPVILVATFRIACAIILEASLSFPGLGVQPPTPRGGR
jgi:peptide/nickel transport system permease protein